MKKLDGGLAVDLSARHFWFTRALVPGTLWGGKSGSSLIAVPNPGLDEVTFELTLWATSIFPS